MSAKRAPTDGGAEHVQAHRYWDDEEEIASGSLERAGPIKRVLIFMVFLPFTLIAAVIGRLGR